MAITVAELKNLITGDDTSYQAAAKRTEASLASLQAKAAQVTAAVTTSFNGFSAPVNGAAAAVAGFGNTVTSTFNNVQAATAAVPASLGAIATEAQVMGAAITASGNGATAALAPLNGAATTAAQGISALGTTAVQAGAGIGELAARKAQLVAELSNVTSAIRSETSVLAGAQSAVANLGGSHSALNNVVRDSEAKLGGYIAQQAILKGELGAVNGALKAAAGAQTATNVVQNAAGVVTEGLGKKTGILSALMTTHTSQISSQGTAWKGYDNVVQAVIRSMGGIPIIWALAITVGGVLLEKLISLGSSKKKVSEITDELVKNDLLLVSAFSALSVEANGVNQVLNTQADRYQKLLSADFSALITVYIEKHKALGSAITDLVAAQNLQTLSQQQLSAASNASAEEMVAATSVLSSSTSAIVEETAAREKAEAAVNKAADTLVFFRDALGKTTAEMLDQVRAAGANEEAIARLTVAMDAGAVAARRLQAAISAAAKPPDFDTSATSGGLEKLFETAALGASLTSAQYQNLAEATLANSKNLKVLTEASQTYAKHVAAAQGITKDKAAVDAIAAAKLRELAGAAGEAGAKVLAQTKLSEQATETTKKMGEAHRGAAGHVKALSAALSEQSVFLKQLNDAMKNIFDSITKKLNDVEIGKILHDKIVPVLEELKRKAQELSAVLTHDLSPALQTMGERALFGDGTFEKLIDRMIDMKRAGEVAAATAKRVDDEFKSLSDHFKDLSRSLPQAWNTITDAIIQGSGKTGTALLNMGVKVKGYASDILNVFDALPGKWGQSLNKGLNEINKWITFIDAGIKLIQRIMGDAQTGLTGVITSIVNVFKGISGAVTTATATTGTAAVTMATATVSSAGIVSGAWQSMAQTATASAAEIQAASATVAAAAATAAGAWQAAKKSSQDSSSDSEEGGGGVFSLIGKIGMIAGIAGSVYGLIKSIFGGKSALQKAQEAAALQQAKDAIKLSVDQVLKSAQEVIQSGIETFNKALEFFGNLDEFTQVRKSKFKEFFANLSRLMDYFAELAGKFSTDSLAQMKAAAEAIGPIAEAIAALPLAFDGIRKHIDVPRKQFKIFFADFDQLMNRFFNLAEQWAAAQTARAKEVAEQLAPVVGIFAPLIEAIKNMANIEEPSKRAFHILFRSLELFVERIAEIESFFDKAVLKAIQNFAEKISPAVELWKSATDAMKAMAEVTPVSEGSFDILVTGIKTFASKFADAIESLASIDLERLSTAATSIGPIMQVIGTAVDNFIKIGTFHEVAPAQFALLADAIRNSILSFVDALDDIAIALLETASAKSGPVKNILDAIGSISGVASALANFPSFNFNNIESATELARRGVDAFINSMKGIDADALQGAVASAGSITIISNALKAWADAAAALKGYTAIAADVWDKVVFDFERGLVLLNLLVVDAQIYVDKATTFKDLIDKGAGLIADAISKYSNSIASAGSALAAGLPQGGAPVGGIAPSSAGALGPLSRNAPLGPMSRNAPVSRQPLTINITELPPTADDLSSYERFKAYKKRFYREVQARALGMGVQIPAYLTE